MTSPHAAFVPNQRRKLAERRSPIAERPNHIVNLQWGGEYEVRLCAESRQKFNLNPRSICHFRRITCGKLLRDTHNVRPRPTCSASALRTGESSSVRSPTLWGRRIKGHCFVGLKVREEGNRGNSYVNFREDERTLSREPSRKFISKSTFAERSHF